MDYLLVGGGLQSALIALAVLERRPASRLTLVERDDRLGGNHTWCFHAADVPGGSHGFVAPLVEHRWDGYEVRFPDRVRVLSSPYAGLSSAHLGRVVRRALEAAGGEVLTGVAARSVGAREVVLEDGRVLKAAAVVDARGPERAPPPRGAGYQKFVGLELELETPHGLPRPVLMDATVPQDGGFRFHYQLPLSPTRLLVEDTYFADDATLDEPRLAAGILAWCRARGLGSGEVVRRERGVLPMPWSGADPAPPFAPLRAGYAGGWFHPGTGYSFPVAARLAAAIADAPPAGMADAAARLAAAHRRQARFARGLNRLLFRWFAPEERWHVLSRFYTLPEATIRRFYALDTTRADRARILVGRPPRGLSLRARLASA